MTLTSLLKPRVSVILTPSVVDKNQQEGEGQG